MRFPMLQIPWQMKGHRSGNPKSAPIAAMRQAVHALQTCDIVVARLRFLGPGTAVCCCARGQFNMPEPQLTYPQQVCHSHSPAQRDKFPVGHSCRIMTSLGQITSSCIGKVQKVSCKTRQCLDTPGDTVKTASTTG